MSKRRAILPLLLLAAAAALLYSLYQQSHQAAVASTNNNLPRYTLMDVDWTRYDAQGQANLKGHADRIDYYADQSATGEALKVDLLRARGEPWVATAPSGTLPAGEQRIWLNGQVRVHGFWPDNNRPLEIDTTRLWIDPNAHEIYTDAGVTFTSTGRNGSATGLRGDWLTQTVNLYAAVRMIYDRSVQ